jgi:tetratricopeptide (TPR) repeat protein
MPHHEQYTAAVESLAALKFHEAAQALEGIREHMLDNADYFFNLGYAWTQLGDFPRAASVYKEMRDRFPGDERGTVGLAISLTRQGQDDAAEPLFKSVLEVNHDNTLVIFELGELYLRRDEYAEAAKYVNTLLDDHQSPELLHSVAQALLGLEKPDAAIQALNTALGLDAELVSCYLLLGIAYQMRDQPGDKAQAIKHLEKFIAAAPGAEEADDARQILTNLREGA